jgi:hypothetical protein
MISGTLQIIHSVVAPRPGFRPNARIKAPLRTISSDQTDLLDRDRFGQVTREVDIQSFSNRKPVGNQLQRDDVQQALKEVHSLGHFDALGFGGWEFRVVLVADDNRSTSTGDD